jgi:site-specific DNA-methyltransferase (adenine-specific)
LIINNKHPRTKLICGECVEQLKLLDDNSIDLIVTDPPYKTTSRGNAGNSGGMLQKSINKKGQVFAYNNIDCSEYAPEFYRVLKDGSHCYVMTNHINLIEMLNTFTSNGFHFIKSLIWNKGNKIMGQFYMSQFEYILFFRKGKGVKINNCGTSDILEVPNKKTKDKDGNNLHDTEKPIKLMEILIENSSKENDIVMDPFMGVGSTGIACVNTNRNFIGVELDENYFNIAKERIENNINQPTLF